MINRVLTYLSLCLLLLMAVSCNQEDYEREGEGTTLTFSVRTIYDVTRGMEDLNDDGIVSDLESFMQGRKMYRLGVFLVENGSTVASTVLEQDDERFSANNTAATVKFENLDYSKSYQLYAVANYGDYGSVEGNVDNITADNITDSHRVTASADNICDAQKPCPLSLKQELKLNPGVNNISGQLTRTNARLRISVRNQSDMKDLTITKLQFPTKFTQSSTDIFSEGGTANVSPVPTSQSAITPFTQDLIIPMIDASGTTSERTIFDAYLLESTGGDYKYTLGLKYAGVGGGTSGYSVDGDAFSVKESIVDGGLYVMYFSYANRYLYANGGVVQGGTTYLTDYGTVNPEYVWRFKKISGQADSYSIESLGATGGYMKASILTFGSSLQLTNTPSSSDYFTISNTTNYNGNMLAKATSATYNYLYVNGSYVWGYSSSWNGYFRLLKLKQEASTLSVTHEETIPIKALDNTGHNLPIETINRNDFIDVLVNVTYNDKTGEVQFEVSNWKGVYGDVTFD